MLLVIDGLRVGARTHTQACGHLWTGAMLGGRAGAGLWLVVRTWFNKQHELYAIKNKLICNSCNIGTSDLPDMYAQSPRAAGPRAKGIHIRQITSAYVTTNM